MFLFCVGTYNRYHIGYNLITSEFTMFQQISVNYNCFIYLCFLCRTTLSSRHVMDNFERDELDDSEEDTVTDYSQMNASTNDINIIESTDFMLRTMPSSTLVPTISVTPHSSPGRNYPVLGIF